MMLDYTGLKALAHEMKCRVVDLLALAPHNDPFYAASPARAEAGQWFAECWERFGFRHGVHLRRTHYVLVSQDPPVVKPNGEPYLNTENDWKFLGTASLAARYLKLIPPDAIVDRRNPEAKINARWLSRPWDCSVHISCRWPDIADALRDDIAFPSYSLWHFHPEQPYLVEVWVEKSTQNDILDPLSRDLGFNLVTGVGEMSETAARLAVGRAVDARKPMHVIYISDFDPAGRSMPVAVARKLQFLVDASELDIAITLQPLALTPEQVARYQLPRTPIKDSETRGAKFEARFGSGATELDALEALHPGELRRLVHGEVSRYIDPTLFSRVYLAERAFEERLEEIATTVLGHHDGALLEARYEVIRNYLAALEEDAAQVFERIVADLEQEKPEIGTDDIPSARPATPVDEPLFDSRRDYLAQSDAYRAWQGRS